MFLFPRTLGELQKWSEAIEKQRRRRAWKRKQNWTHALTFACFPFSFLPLQLSPCYFCTCQPAYLRAPSSLIPSAVAPGVIRIPQRTSAYFHSFPSSLPAGYVCTAQRTSAYLPLSSLPRQPSPITFLHSAASATVQPSLTYPFLLLVPSHWNDSMKTQALVDAFGKTRMCRSQLKMKGHEMMAVRDHYLHLKHQALCFQAVTFDKELWILHWNGLGTRARAGTKHARTRATIPTVELSSHPGLPTSLISFRSL